VPVLGEGHAPVEQAAEVGLIAMHLQHEILSMLAQEQLALDVSTGHPYQRQGVRLMRAVIAGDVQHRRKLAAGPEYRRAGAGQEMIALDVMLGRKHHDRLALHDRGTHGVGALAVLGPGHPGLQRHALGARQELRIPEGMQDEPVGSAQQHHAAGALYLLVQDVHHRLRSADQFGVALQRGTQITFVNAPDLTHAVALKTGLRATHPGAADYLGNHAVWDFTGVQKKMVGAANQCRVRQGAVTHAVLLLEANVSI
jgi:hypothetical protein